MIVVKDPETLKRDITSNGNTMTSTADYIGCSKSYISSIVSGVRNPNEKTAVGICEVTGKQFDTYFFIKSVNNK